MSKHTPWCSEDCNGTISTGHACMCRCHDKPQPEASRDELVAVMRKALDDYNNSPHTYAFGQEVEFVADALIAAGWRKEAK